MKTQKHTYSDHYYRRKENHNLTNEFDITE